MNRTKLPDVTRMISTNALLSNSAHLGGAGVRRIFSNTVPVCGGSLRDAQAQLGHSKMSTTLEIYTLPIPEQQRATVEKLSVLMASDGTNGQNSGELPLATTRLQ